MPKGLKIWNDKSSKSALRSAMKHGAGWIAEHKSGKRGTRLSEGRCFDGRAWHDGLVASFTMFNHVKPLVNP